MSLAATLAAGGMRPASSLPTIKCSSCNDEIEISAMGEHTCGKTAPSTKSAHSSMSSTAHSSISSSMSNPFSLRQANANAPAQPSPLQFSSDDTPKTRVRAPTVGSSQIPAGMAPRTAPPRVNTDVANKPFLAPMYRPESPISPAASAYSSSSNGSRRPPLRSMTSPAPRIFDPRPSSPEMSANLDCAFPPFPPPPPITGGSRPSSSNGRRTPSERASSRTGSRLDLYSLEPKSPMSHAGENVLNRMNTLKSGPFDPTRRRPSNDDRSQREPRSLDKRRPSVPEERRPSEELPPLPSQTPQPVTLESKFAEQPASNHQLPEPGQAAKVPPERPLKPTEQLSPTFLSQLSTEPSSTPPPVQPLAPLRSRTFPAPQSSNGATAVSRPLSKMASEPALRTQASSTDTSKSEPSEPEQTQYPARSQSKKEARIDYRMQDAPPVPTPVQLHRSDSLHRPSESGSSTTSSVPSLGNSNSSINPSPVGSATSSVDILSSMTYDAGKYGEAREARVAGLNINKNRQKPGMRAEQPKERSPPRNMIRPSPPKEIILPVELPPVLPGSSSWPLESPMDPAMQHQKLGEAAPESSNHTSSEAPMQSATKELAPAPSNPSNEEYDPYRTASPQLTPEQQPQGLYRSRTATDANPYHTERPQGPLRSKTDTESKSQAFESGASIRSATPPFNAPSLSQGPAQDQSRTPQPQNPPPVPLVEARPGLARRQTTGTKAKCRGCSIQIEGKSVKAADGRLTGRWHKACFVCKTCKEPFTTADFYVINNHPYCEQHYHEKNGSVCNGCHRGIEGQYLETHNSGGPNEGVGKKYHRRCFTCFDCRMVLAEDYFEIEGRVFCERHALAAMRGQARPKGPGSPGLSLPHGGSSLKAERRTTKLMMM